MNKTLAVVSVLCVCDANAVEVFQGTQTSLTLTNNNVQLSQKGKVVFDALQSGRKILNASTCQHLSYRILPLSKVGSVFSFLEEVYLEGGECGLRGHSYNLSIRALNLNTGNNVTITSIAPMNTVLKGVQRDKYIQGISGGKSWYPETMDRTFSSWNTSYCAKSVTPEIFKQFYVYDGHAQPSQVRLGLAFDCGEPMDDIQTPVQLGISLKVKFNPSDDFDFRSIRAKVGRGVELQLKRN